MYLKHKDRIESFTKQLIGQHTRPNQPLLVSKDIQSVFDAYIDKCIYHFEKLSDTEHGNDEHYYDEYENNNKE